MNRAVILAGGTGVRMNTKGLPKQFLELSGKPIIIHTLEVFDACEFIDDVVIPCNPEWIGYMRRLLMKYRIRKVSSVVPGGADRQASIINGLDELRARGAEDDDVVIIHDGVRPLVSPEVLVQNCITAQQHGSAVTVRPNSEGVVVTRGDTVKSDGFMRREDTYTLTAPQSFLFGEVCACYAEAEERNINSMLDTALMYAELGRTLHLVYDEPGNIKITTPDDFYYFRAHLELEESKRILGV